MTQMRWRLTYHGRYWKQSQWSKPSERAMIMESTLWIFDFRPVAAGGKIAPMRVGKQNSAATLVPLNGARPGGNNYDIYRHGKYPRVINSTDAGQVFDPNGGKIAYNVCFADGSARTLTDREQGYYAIRFLMPQ
jgi:prepilin-type processing-associated H-X9-DG protein